MMLGLRGLKVMAVVQHNSMIDAFLDTKYQALYFVHNIGNNLQKDSLKFCFSVSIIYYVVIFQSIFDLGFHLSKF